MIRSYSFALLVVLALAGGSPASAGLSAHERKIVLSVDRDAARNVALLERLVNQNSGSLNLPGVEKVGAMMRAELEPLGFVVEWVPMLATGRAGHIVATHRGNGRGKRLLLIGHLDTVFEPDSPFQTFTLKGGKAQGPGAGDNKGGMVVMVAALRAMQSAGTLKDADIVVVLTGDEEDSGSPLETARRDLIAAGKASDVALDFEGLAQDEGKDMGSIARRGVSSWTVTVTAKSAHSGGIFSKAAGDGAIYALAQILTAFRHELLEPNLTFNTGLIAGGTTAQLDAGEIRATASGKTNIIPAIAIARGDLRTLSDAQSARVQTKMQAIVDRVYAGATAKMAFGHDGYPAMAPTPGNRLLLDQLNIVNRDLGLATMDPLDPLKRGAGDISFVARYVDGLVGLGVASDGDHTPAETADLTTIPRQAKRAAILMTRLSRTPR